jgi:hypothetical protein
MPGEATFKVQSWDEKPAQELATGAKVTRAKVTQAYSGGIEGAGTIEYVMFHRSDGTATFAGFEFLEGSVHGKSGSLVLHHTGTYEAGAAKSDWRVVAGSGTAALEGAKGSGSFEAGHDGIAKVTYEIDSD